MKVNLKVNLDSANNNKPQDVLHLEAESIDDRITLCRIADKLSDVGIGPLNIEGAYSIEIPLASNLLSFKLG